VGSIEIKFGLGRKSNTDHARSGEKELRRASAQVIRHLNKRSLLKLDHASCGPDCNKAASRITASDAL
jgi:hypothetical protein